MTTSFRVTLTITRPEKLFFFAPDKKTLQGQTWLPPPHTHTGAYNLLLVSAKTLSISCQSRLLSFWMLLTHTTVLNLIICNGKCTRID